MAISETVMQFAFLSIMVVGLLGLLTTIIPGLTIIWISALVYFLATKFTTGSIILMVVLTLLMLGGNLIDNVIMGASAKKTGASWLAVGVALVAGVLGTFLIPIPVFGGLIAALGGIFLVEFLRLRDWRLAVNSARGLAAGCGWSVVVRFGIGLVMILSWLIYVLVAR